MSARTTPTTPSTHPTPVALGSLAALGIVCTAVAYILFFRLVSSIGPTKVSTVTYLVPVFGTTWGALFLGEPVTAGMLIGLLLVLTSVVVVNEVRVSSMLPSRRPVGSQR